MSDATEYGLDVLVFAPHPDDAEICCGGMLLGMKALGYCTGIVDLTKGEMGTKGSAETRAGEASLASGILNLDTRENLALPDGGISAHESVSGEDSQMRRVGSVLRRLRPRCVFAPYWGARHPDHVEASSLVTKACFYSGLGKYDTGDELPSFAPAALIYYQMRGEFRPSFIVDISSVAGDKMKAILCYESQLGGSGEGDAPETLVSNPLNLRAIEARDAYFGAMIGVKAGEAFYTKQAMPLSDPVGHFRENPMTNALFFPADS